MPRSQDPWDAHARDYARTHARTLADDVVWGPSMPPERELRVLGDVRGKDVIEIGCGGAQALVHVKRRLGARRAAGVDFSAKQVAIARRNAARAKVDVELLQSSAEDLSAFRARSFDVAFSAFAYGFVKDVDLAFREAFRVLRSGGLFAFSWSSPLHEITELTPEGMLLVAKSYWMRAPFSWTDEYGTWTEYPRTFSDWHRALTQAGFVVEDVLEPEPVDVQSTYRESHPLSKITRVPGTIIWRARKRGR